MPDDIVYAYAADITKKDPKNRIVEGFVSSGRRDTGGHIIDPAWLKSALPPWMASYGNIREQHDPKRAAGRAKSVDLTTTPGPHLSTKIVDPLAWEKCEEGVYNGFSVGIKNPKIVRDAEAPNGRIVGGDLIEISLVDRPANEDARFTLLKALGANEWKDAQSGAVVEWAPLPVPDVAKCDLDGCDCTCKPGAPDPDCDCQCAMCQAARASVGMDADGDFDGDKAASAAENALLPDVMKRDFSAEERKALAAKGHALPDGSYPIPDKDALGRALTLARSGHGNVAAAKRLIKRRAKALGATDMLPEDWGGPSDDDGDSDDQEKSVSTDVAAVATTDVDKAMNRPKSSPDHVHPFKGVHNHEHDDTRGGTHTHAHQHDDDDLHDHPHLGGKDARMLSPEEAAQHMALQRASAFMAADTDTQATEADTTKAADDFAPPAGGNAPIGRPAPIGDVLTMFKDALGRLEALAGETDQDRDGDVDFKENMAGGAMDPRRDAGFQAERPDPDSLLIKPRALALDFAATPDLVKALDGNEAFRVWLNRQIETAATALAEPLVTKAAEAESQVSALKADLEKQQTALEEIKRLAQPAKGVAAYPIDKGIYAPDRIYADGRAPEAGPFSPDVARRFAALSETERRDFMAAVLKAQQGG